ncbi:MAG: hypothetical protein ABSF88_09975 [Candidatus Aminicenantales bacterium]
MRRTSLLFVGGALLICTQAGLSRQDSYRYERRLSRGDHLLYEMRTSTEGDPAELLATVRLNVVERDGVVQEQVEWLSVRDTAAGERPMALAPYDLLAHPRTVIASLTGADDADLLGLVTDLYTLFFSVSPLAGSRKVHVPGDSYTRPEFVIGDWSNGASFRVGRDRLVVTVRLEALDARRARFVTQFLPPSGAAWRMHRPWMEAPVCGSVGNNFEMVRADGSRFVVLWGCEEFTVRSTVDRATGRILDAEMDNRLVWRVRVCGDETLSQCVVAPNLTRRRHVTLQLQNAP